MTGPNAFGETCDFFSFNQHAVTGGTFNAIAPVLQQWYTGHQHNLPGVLEENTHIYTINYLE